ncbi:Nn.00g105870.m01.CDS01 [Neocucurbitaria sp. VM-36]
MGNPTTPQEAAPAYDDVFADRPVNGYKPSGSMSAYAAVPQDDDVELHAHDHTHNDSSSAPAESSSAPETFAQTIAGVFRPKPHVHCEQCDVQLAARQRRENEKHCCNMVAATFMTAFVCIFFGVVLTSSVWAKKHRHA